MITITLEGIPQGKARPRFGKGRTYTPTKTEEYEERLAWAGRQAMRGQPMFGGPLHVVLRAYFPVPESWPQAKKAAALAGTLRPVVKPDVDNLLKMLDACNKVVWRDDAQIVSLTASKHYSAEPRLVVEVSHAVE